MLLIFSIFAVTSARVFSMQTAALDQRELSAEYLLPQEPYIIIASRNVTQRDRSGQTALHHAAKNGHAGFIRDLIICGANPIICDFNRIPPLFYAIEHKHWK